MCDLPQDASRSPGCSLWCTPVAIVTHIIRLTWTPSLPSGSRASAGVTGPLLIPGFVSFVGVLRLEPRVGEGVLSRILPLRPLGTGFPGCYGEGVSSVDVTPEPSLQVAKAGAPEEQASAQALLLLLLATVPCPQMLALNGNRLTRAVLRQLTDTHKDPWRRIFACLADISAWLSAHHLKLNPDKTELL
ncbi:uncharacterized protein ACWYII_037602 [Salvelinus alpinus]